MEIEEIKKIIEIKIERFKNLGNMKKHKSYLEKLKKEIFFYLDNPNYKRIT